jgi:phospholipid/cholesterol/gamma-HCH transport system substrate-binding protein
METRASHIAVGAFVMLLLIGGFGFVIWVSKFSERTATVNHFVRFSGSVQGLNVGSNVLFGGIPIGHVTAINIDRQDSSLARVDMTVNADAPIRSDSVATLDMQGITGGVLVEISRGTPKGQRVKDGSEIPLGYTALQRLLTGAPELVSKGNQLLDSAEMFLTTENVATATRIMANVQKFVALVAVHSDEFSATLDQVTTAGKQIANTNTEFRKLGVDMRDFGGKLSGQIDSASRDIHALTSLLGTIANNYNKIFNDNRRPIQEFTATGLFELSQMIIEVQRAVQTVRRISTEIARDPTQYFFQDRQSGFQAPGMTKLGH